MNILLIIIPICCCLVLSSILSGVGGYFYYNSGYKEGEILTVDNKKFYKYENNKIRLFKTGDESYKENSDGDTISARKITQKKLDVITKGLDIPYTPPTPIPKPKPTPTPVPEPAPIKDCLLASAVYQEKYADIGYPGNVWFDRPFDHYKQFGKAEGRTWSSKLCDVQVDPSIPKDCEFAQRVYKRLNADIGSPGNFWFNRPFDHYKEYGKGEGRIWPNVCNL